MIKNKKVFVNTLIAIVLLEALSFIAYSNPWLNPWIFGIVSIAIIIATVYKLEYGVFIAIAELIIGSLGRMMVLELNGADVSLRMAIWIIVLCVWLARVIKKKEISFFKSQLFVPFMMLSAIILWGIIWGAMRGNNLGLIFNDANNYFYFALIFPVYGVLRSRKIVERLHYVITAAILFLALKT
ncbi:hypothetical protein KKF64_00325, partial [Patescibacteria group bacterium]|nr:hypothetical protein [Patescibacteria group bacterium]